MRADRREVARYLGYGRAPLPAETEIYAAACEEELSRTAVPRTLSRRLPAGQLPGVSGDLDRHLRNCRDVILYAVTLGAETDRLLRRWSAQTMAKAAVGQAVCAVWLDELCDELCGRAARDLAPGEYLTAPFSPGYGDWSLSVQQSLLDLLSAHKRIGLTLTAGGMLAPEKSITAVAGISDREEDACGRKCMRSGNLQCPNRAAP